MTQKKSWYNHKEQQAMEDTVNKNVNPEWSKKVEDFFKTPVIAPYYPINPKEQIENASETKGPVNSPDGLKEQLPVKDKLPNQSAQAVTHEERLAEILRDMEKNGWSYERAYNALCIY